MKNTFVSEDLMQAYKVVKPGVPALIATKGAAKGLYNLTPIAWIMPFDYEPVTQLIFSCAPEHQCDANIKRTKRFAVCIPSDQDDSIIGHCGSVSSIDIDKFALFGIDSIPADKIDVRVPAEHCSAWIECELVKILHESTVDLFIGKAVAAFKRPYNG